MFVIIEIGQPEGAETHEVSMRNVTERPCAKKKKNCDLEVFWNTITKLSAVIINMSSTTATLLNYNFVRVDQPFPLQAFGSKSHYSTGFFFPLVYIDQGHILVKNSFRSSAVSTQETAVTFPVRKVMHFDRRHWANPSNHAAQTTAHCSPEACCYSCCLITLGMSGAERHSEYQKGRKAVLLIH